MTHLPGWQRALSAIAALKIAIGIGAVMVILAVDPAAVEPRHWLMLAHTAVYAGTAWVLMVGGARDRRALLLGMAFVLTASVFADTLWRPWQGRSGTLLLAAQAFFVLQVDSFTPYFLWRFVGQFPRGPDFGMRYHVVRIAARISAVVGVALFALNLLRLEPLAQLTPQRVLDVAHHFSRTTSGAGYWRLWFALALPVLVLLWTGRAKAAPDERRRVAMLTLGLAVCIGPTFVWVFAAEMWPAFRVAVPLRVVGFVIYPLLLVLPLWTTYVVRVHHALDVRLVARHAVQYALARQTALLLSMVPFLVLVFEIYEHRTMRVAELLDGPIGVTVVVLAGLSVAALRGRRATLEWLDRRYFREQYDARTILSELVERCRSARSRGELAGVLRSQIGSALHSESTHLLVFEEHADAFVSSDADLVPLETSRALLRIAELQDGAFDTDLEMHETAVSELPEEDRAWLADCGAKLGLPLKRPDGVLIGLLLLGERKSELPYTDEDRRWLGAVGAAAALGLNSVLADDVRRSGEPVATKEAVVAVECVRCGSVYPALRSRCERCEGTLEPTGLPLIVAGKFRLIQRIGDGAMGVVYRGIDVQLSRAVAIKTLPRLQAAAASRLRREARVIASVSHPSLASIYGVESWRGMPMLVLEHLPGGTLADRLAKGPIPSAEVLQIGVTLADALAAVHRAGILHRDVKPSNIGFTADGSPKLLDFGVSRLLGRAAQENPGDSSDRIDVRSALAETHEDLRQTTTADGRVVGTPLYLSPEALRAERPEPSFDLWGLCVVLFEAMAGRHPFGELTVSEVMLRISHSDLPDIRDYLPGADPALSAFFQRVFSSSPAHRAPSAEALRGQLTELLAR